MAIRTFNEADWPVVWELLKPVFRAGETYAIPPDVSEAEARRIWIDAPQATYVAMVEDEIVGTYYIKPNHDGAGNHVCNCGYVVSERARGKGVASAMCEHSQQTARDLGFHAMQYNLVVATNTGAVCLWEKLGFEIIGTLPRAFRHPEQGLVDAHVMYKWLRDAR